MLVLINFIALATLIKSSMKKIYTKRGFLMTFLLGCFIGLFGVEQTFAQQTIGAHPTIDAGFENQSASLTGTSLPSQSSTAPNTSTTAWAYSISGNGQVKAVFSTGGYGGPKYLSVGKLNPTSNTSTTAVSNVISSGTFLPSTKYIYQFHYKVNAGAIDTASYVFISADNTSGTRASSFLNSLTTNTTWTKYTRVITTGANQTTLGTVGIVVKMVGTATGSNSGVLDVDNMVVYPADDQNNPTPDVAAPDAPTSVSATSGPSVVNVSWSAPSSGVDGGGYLVVRYTSDPSAEPDPLQNAVYKVTATNTIGNGTVVYVGTATSFSDGTGTPGTNYWYRVYTADKAFNYSTPIATTSSASPQLKLNYYYDGTGSTDDLNNWWSNSNLTGTHPVSFADPGQVFRIITNADLVSTLAITGVGSLLVIGDPAGVPAMTIDFNSTSLPGIDTIYESSTPDPLVLNFNTSSVPSINQMLSLFVEAHYRAAGTSLSTSKIFNKIFVENNADVTFSGSPSVVSSFEVETGAAATVGTLSTRWLTVLDGGTVTINGKINTPKLVGLVSSNVGAGASTNGAIQFIGNGDIVLGPNSTVEYSGISTQTTQSITPRTDYVNMIISGVGVSKTMTGPITISGTLTMNTTGLKSLILSTPLLLNGGLTLNSGKIISTTANLLTIGASASLTGGNSTSFVDGPMNRKTASTASYTLPVGKGTICRPIALTPSNASAAEFQAEFMNTAYSDLTYVSPLTNVDTTYWSVSKISGTANVAVSLSLDGATVVPNTTIADELVVAQYNGTDWVSISQISINPLPAITGTASSTSVSVSTNNLFTFGIKPTSALPVKLISFKGALQNGKPRLNWITADESDIVSFILEESKDGIVFSSIGTFEAKNSPTANYLYNSSTLLNGLSYYRLRINEKAGKYTYSNVVTLKNENKTKISICNNGKISNDIQLKLANIAAGNYTLQLLNTNGQVIKTKSFHFDGEVTTQSIQKGNISRGVYLIRLLGNNVYDQGKVVIP